MATAPSAPPLPSSSSAPPSFQPTWASAPSGGPSAPPPRRRSGIRIVVVVVVVIIVIGLIGLVFFATNQTVNVTIIEFSSPDNTCGWNGLTDSGFSEPPGGALAFSYYNYGNNTTGSNTAACVVHTVTTNTSGFSITDANTPLITPANVTNFLNFTVNLPDSSYNGPLWIILT